MYRPIPMNPTSEYKTKLINILRKIKGNLAWMTPNRRMYPTGASSHKFYGHPKIHEKRHPFRPVVSSRRSVIYGVAKELARILQPLVGKVLHYMQNIELHRTSQEHHSGNRMHHLL